MITKRTVGTDTWIDLTNPTAEEVRELASEYHLSDRVVEDLTTPTLRHTVEFGEHNAYLVLHFPAFRDGDDAAFEVDFVVGKNYLITAHYGENRVMAQFRETPSTPAFFGLLHTLLNDFDAKLAEVDHWVRDTEKQMFDGAEKKTIFELSEASRHLIDFKKITAVYPDSFKELKEQGKQMFGNKFVELVDEVLASFGKAEAKMNLLSESVHELRETNSSVLSAKQNETMKTLTSVTVVATIIVGIALIWLGYLALK